jgi:hypothetical protein
MNKTIYCVETVQCFFNKKLIFKFIPMLKVLDVGLGKLVSSVR